MANAIGIANTGVNYGQMAFDVGSKLAPAAFGSGALATIGTALGIAGVGLVALPAVINLFKCGTISSIGCVKRADTEIDKQGEILARKVIWAVESGQTTPDKARAAIATIWTAMNQAWAEKQRSGYAGSFDGFCGSDPAANPAYNIQIGAPANSQAVTFLCGQNNITREYMFTVAFPALIDRLAAAQAKPVGPAPVSSAALATTSATGTGQAAASSSAGTVAATESSLQKYAPLALLALGAWLVLG